MSFICSLYNYQNLCWNFQNCAIALCITPNENMLVSVYLQNACNNIKILSIYIIIMIIMNMNKSACNALCLSPTFIPFMPQRHNVIESDKTYWMAKVSWQNEHNTLKEHTCDDDHCISLTTPHMIDTLSHRVYYTLLL